MKGKRRKAAIAVENLALAQNAQGFTHVETLQYSKGYIHETSQKLRCGIELATRITILAHPSANTINTAISTTYSMINTDSFTWH